MDKPRTYVASRVLASDVCERMADSIASVLNCWDSHTVVQRSAEKVVYKTGYKAVNLLTVFNSPPEAVSGYPVVISVGIFVIRQNIIYCYGKAVDIEEILEMIEEGVDQAMKAAADRLEATRDLIKENLLSINYIGLELRV